MEEREHVLNLLKKSKKAAQRGDVVLLKQLSDQTIHSVSIFQDEDNMLAAIVIYALAKLIERRDKYSHKDFEDYLRFYLHTLDDSISCLERKDCDHFRRHVADMIRKTAKLPLEFKDDVQYIFRKARINKASKVYEHGISMEKTARLLGISQWELAEYTGPTGSADLNNRSMDIKKRVRKAMEMFE